MLTVQIYTSSEAGDIAPTPLTTTGQGTVFSLGYPAGAKSGTGTVPGEAGVEILAKLDYIENPVGAAPNHSIVYGGPDSNLYADANSGIITTGDKCSPTVFGAAGLNTINSTIISTNDLSATWIRCWSTIIYYNWCFSIQQIFYFHIMLEMLKLQHLPMIPTQLRGFYIKCWSS